MKLGRRSRVCIPYGFPAEHWLFQNRFKLFLKNFRTASLFIFRATIWRLPQAAKVPARGSDGSLLSVKFAAWRNFRRPIEHQVPFHRPQFANTMAGRRTEADSVSKSQPPEESCLCHVSGVNCRADRLSMSESRPARRLATSTVLARFFADLKSKSGLSQTTFCAASYGNEKPATHSELAG